MPKYDFNLKIEAAERVERSVAKDRKKSVIENSRRKFARSRAGVETEMILARPSVESKPKESLSEQKDESPKPAPIVTGTKPAEIKTIQQQESQHQYLQTIIKRIGEKEGFVATLEKQVLGGVGKIDVALERNGFQIACEVAVTNTVEYELQNIQKCLVSGFDKVAVISPDEKHLSKVRRKTDELIAESYRKRIYFLSPDSFHLFLGNLRAQVLNDQGEIRVKGYKVAFEQKQVEQNKFNSRKQILADVLEQVKKRI